MSSGFEARSSATGPTLAGLAVVLVIAACGSGPNPDQYGTWLWNGTTWTQLSKTDGGGGTLLYWKGGGGLVSSSGMRWNGSSWVADKAILPSPPVNEVQPPGSGADRTIEIVDQSSGQLLYLDPNSETMSAWVSGAWTTVVGPGGWPEARYLFDAANDPVHGGVLIDFCCYPYGYSQTWWWNERKLVQVANPPSDFGFDLLVPDGVGGVVAIGAGSAYTWDGRTWSPLSPSTAFPRVFPGSSSDIVYDPSHNQIIASGVHYKQQGEPVLSTWLWREGTWQLIVSSPPAPPPDACGLSNLVYDPELAGVVLTNLPEDNCITGPP
jgi:hypothetical protein